MPIPTPIDNYYKYYETNDEDSDDITIITSNATSMKKSSKINPCEQPKLSSEFLSTSSGTVVERLSHGKWPKLELQTGRWKLDGVQIQTSFHNREFNCHGV